MIWKIIGTLILSVASGVFYRMGGSGNYPRWTRQVGICICMAFELMLLGYFSWTIILCIGALYGLSTTYFKKKGTDAIWLNWLLVGVAFSISVLPIVLVYHNYIGFAIRTVVCTALVTIWSQAIGKDVVEEFGRGFIIVATLPLLLWA